MRGRKMSLEYRAEAVEASKELYVNFSLLQGASDPETPAGCKEFREIYSCVVPTRSTIQPDTDQSLRPA